MSNLRVNIQMSILERERVLRGVFIVYQGMKGEGDRDLHTRGW
jgi:hypothetical protein